VTDTQYDDAWLEGAKRSVKSWCWPSSIDDRAASDALGDRAVHMKEYRALGVERTIDRIRERVGDAPAYITFGLGAFDPTAAPAAANIQPDATGFFMEEALAILDGPRGPSR
jgi:arginase family enzyme